MNFFKLKGTDNAKLADPEAPAIEYYLIVKKVMAWLVVVLINLASLTLLSYGFSIEGDGVLVYVAIESVAILSLGTLLHWRIADKGVKSVIPYGILVTFEVLFLQTLIFSTYLYGDGEGPGYASGYLLYLTSVLLLSTRDGKGWQLEGRRMDAHNNTNLPHNVPLPFAPYLSLFRTTTPDSDQLDHDITDQDTDGGIDIDFDGD